jgi:hypothetical protein
MSRNELKAIVDRSSAQERLFLSAYLQHLGAKNDPAVQADLANANKEISRGRKIGLRQMKQLHRSLSKAGL